MTKEKIERAKVRKAALEQKMVVLKQVVANAQTQADKTLEMVQQFKKDVEQEKK